MVLVYGAWDFQKFPEFGLGKLSVYEAAQWLNLIIVEDGLHIGGCYLLPPERGDDPLEGNRV